jgi:hypothetical protein
MGQAAGKVLGCGTSALTKALAGGASGATVGAGAQMVSNVIEGKEDIMDGVGDAALTGGVTGAAVGSMQKTSCFVAGTLVSTPESLIPIEQLRCGRRVLTPQGSGKDSQSTEVNPETWRLYRLQLKDARTGWDVFAIELLRPAEWLESHLSKSRGEAWIEIDELQVVGWAKLIEVFPCPEIEAGPGRVVTATVHHANDDVRLLRLSGGTSLEVTGNHRLFSADRNLWVPVKELRPGEALRRQETTASVESVSELPGRITVYNLEVEQEHCYFVGNDRILAHNACSPEGSARENAEARGHLEPEELAYFQMQEVETGSYTIRFKSKNTYDGFGAKARAIESAQEKSWLHDDPIESIDHTPAESLLEGYKQESRRLDSNGGPKSPKTYNKIESPGKNFRRRDGDS